MYAKAGQEPDHQRRVAHYNRVQDIAAEDVPLIDSVQGERIETVRTVFGDTAATLHSLWYSHCLCRTDR